MFFSFILNHESLPEESHWQFY